MSRYVLKTLGCKANFYDSQLIEEELQKKGWLPKEDVDREVEICIINSCTVTDEADRQTRKMAARLAKENPQAKVIVTGCAAEVDPKSLSEAPGVHFVVGNQNKNQLVDLVLGQLSPSSQLDSHILNTSQSPKILGTVQSYQQILSKHPTEREWPAATESFYTPPTQLKGYSAKTRAFLKIQEGCNSFCTYCIIPYGRGPSRSLRPREALDQIRELIDQGIREIVITGTNIGDYGTDWGQGPALDDLCEQILNETSLERLRVSSLDPTEITPKLMALMAENPRFCPHFHVSLQSPHSRILRLMKRKYAFEEVKQCLEAIAQIPSPVGGVFVGMDVITGFPGETEEEFEWGVEALSQLPWSRLHVFPYSERSGTPATRLPNSVPQHIRVQRTKRLNQLSLERLTQHYRKVLEECNRSQSSLKNVLLERAESHQWIGGYTDNYLRVLIPQGQGNSIGRNQMVEVTPIDMTVDRSGGDVALVGKLI